ncbi:hypothetical protein ETD86_54060 [Nonomuraea turkmeniaca]|uniref:Uncharacterized protein n=1 Tax=Nonomuraea turkmeniaca TaxID=103838 RepID=A0A5S4EUG0_9ACTN|nr:hypothetical protein [Nonomuraea turkmeniaca]TMR03009.1 hypothetical protein ETD86_54060 [Nonomuraea turkmeniaca]
MRLPIEHVERFLLRERDEHEARSQRWNNVDVVLNAFRLHMHTGTPLTQPRPSDGPEDLSVGRPSLTEAEELRAELDRLKEKHEREMLKLIDERDRMRSLLDLFAYTVAPAEVIGEHTSGSDPWANALHLITPAAEVKHLRAALNERGLDEAVSVASGHRSPPRVQK